MSAQPAAPGCDTSDNVVFLRGALAAEPQTRILPSGDEICSFRLTVARPAGGRAPVDSIDCAALGPRVRRTLARAVPGDALEVSGELHRRFWRGAGGVASRYEVEVSSARLTRRRNGA